MPCVAVAIQDREVPVQLTNPTDSFVTLRKGYDIGYLEEVTEIFEDPDEAIVDEKSADSSEKDATKLSAGEQSARSKIRRCTVSTEEMPGTTEDPLTKLKVVNEGTSKQPEGAKDKHTRPDKDEESLCRELEEAVQALPEYVQDLYEWSTTHLDLSEHIILAKFIKEFRHIFATSDDDLGCCTVIEHEIDTGDAKPVCQRMRHISKEFKGEAEKCIQKMWDNNTIQSSNSEWASPSVLVRKKGGSVCWCIGFRSLNKVTKKDAFPLPLIKDCLDSLSGVQYMSTLDMNSGYFQFMITAKDQYKTAFLTKLGLFKFRGLAMGLFNAPATFQRAMQLIFRGMTWKEILSYLDDLNVLGTSFEDHLTNLRKSFKCIRQYGLKLKPRKCCFLQTEVPFLG